MDGMNQYEISDQIEAMVRDLEAMGGDVKEIILESVTEGAELIAQKQRGLISGYSSQLAQHIAVHTVEQKDSGYTYALVGYMEESTGEAFHGLVLEYGRPGRHRKGIDSKKRKIGRLQAVPHIRPGFDLAKEEAVAISIKNMEKALERWSG